MSPLATTILLLLAGRAVAAGEAFTYPYKGAQSYDETLMPGACVGVFAGVNTDFICSCATSETYSAFVSCIPATSDEIKAYCGGIVNSGTCYTSVCPDGICETLEFTGSVVPTESCASGQNLGYQIGKGCGCYDDASGRYTACQGDSSSLVCISEQLYLGGVGTGATSYLCGAAIPATSASSTSGSASATSPTSATPIPISVDIPSTTVSPLEGVSTTVSPATSSTATTATPPTASSSDSSAATSTPTPFVYPFVGPSSVFDETLAPGTCPGVFSGSETDFICDCVSSEATGVWVNCRPVDAVQVSTFCSGGTNTASCYLSLCPGGTCSPLEISGYVVTPAACSADQALGYVVPGACGCFSSTSSFSSCEAPGTANVCVSERILGTQGTGGMESRCVAQCEPGYAPNTAGICTLAPSSTSATSTSASATTSATSSSIASVTPSPTTNLNAEDFGTVTETETLSFPTSDGSCYLYRFAFAAECCPTIYLHSLKSLSRRKVGNLNVAHHERRGHHNGRAIVTETVTTTIYPQATGCSPQTVYTEDTCDAGHGRKAQKLTDRVLLRHFKKTGGRRVLVDCGEAGLFTY